MPRSGSLADIIALIAAAPAGARVQVPTGLAQSEALISALQADPQAAAEKTFAGLFIPGVDMFDYTRLHPTARMETPLMAAHLRNGFEAGQLAPLPMSYRKVYDRLEKEGCAVGVAVTTSGEGNTLSFGVCADAGPALLKGAQVKIALLNEAAPRIPNDRTATAPREAFDLIVPVDEPLNWVKPETPAMGVLARVADQAARLVDDHDVLQSGIGKLPGAILARLTSRRRLSIFSGLYSEGVIDLLDAGAIAQDLDVLTAGTALGSARLAERLVNWQRAQFAPVDFTHDPARMAEIRRFTALNGALQVDLFGQVNAEFVNGKLISGPGGLPDFVAGANQAARGRAIIALPSLAGEESRIVPQLTAPWITLPRGSVHYVVTEHGVASLRNKTIDQVADALIGVADPSVQGELAAAWGTIRSRF